MSTHPDGFESERLSMVEAQVERRGIRDPRVLEAMRSVPRHRFVSRDLEGSAYSDCPLPIGFGQTISQPYMVALMTERLQLKGEEKVLEVGTGSGYQAAVLAHLAREVYSIERVPELGERARDLLASLGVTNVTIGVFDGTKGWREHAPYDGIVVTAGAPQVPDALTAQLVEGGRLVIPVGGTYSQDLLVVRKTRAGLETESVCGCVFVPLIGECGWEKG